MRNFVVVALLLAILCLPVLAFGENGWARVRSKNFVVSGAVSESVLRRVDWQFENLHGDLQRVFPQTDLTAVMPTQIVAFGSNAELTAICGDGRNAGFLVTGEAVNYIALSDESADSSTVFHDYARFVINQKVGRAVVPVWLNEGLAQDFADSQTDAAAAAKNLRLLQTEKWIPLEKLTAKSYYAWGSEGDDNAALFAAESWWLVYHLPQNRIAEFVQSLQAGISQAEAFKTAFGADLAQIEKSLRDVGIANSNQNSNQKRARSKRVFGEGEHTYFVRVSDVNLSKLEFEVEPNLSPAEVLVYKADLLRLSNRSDAARTMLEAALKSDEKSWRAHAVLGLTLARQNRFDEAVGHLTRAVELEPDNFLAHYYRAFAASLEAMDASGFVRNYAAPKADLMRHELNKTIELQPNFACAYALRAFVNFTNRKDFDNAIADLDKARKLEAGDEQFALQQAQIFLQQADFERLRQAARPIFATAEDVKTRSQAQLLLYNADTYEAQLKALDDPNRRGLTFPKDGDIYFPPDELINQSIIEALRRLRVGEQRAFGFLDEIQCTDDGVTFAVRAVNANQQTFKFRAAEFQKVTFIAFTKQANRQIVCGKRAEPDLVVATYRPIDNAKNDFNGELVALEFVPPTLRLQP